MIPYGRQHITDDDITAVTEVLRSPFLTQGPVVPQFEQAMAHRVKTGFAVATTNATSALHLACRALDIGPGDRVWTSPNTFVASANVARQCGAEVDFVDIDDQTFNLCMESLADKLAKASKTGELPKAVIPVDFAGHPCDMARLRQLRDHYGFYVIEDASHAIGAFYDGEPVGGLEVSDITVFSFHPVKIITTGEGGMALTRSAELAERLSRLRSHGITRDPERMTHEPDGDWYYQQLQLGYNYRMTELQAALGLSQLQHLDAFIQRRRTLADQYRAALSDTDLTLPVERPQCRSSYHLYVVQTAPKRRRALFDRLRERGIGVNVHYIPVYRQPYYQRLGFRAGHCPRAEAYYQRCVSLPMFPDLTDEDQATVVRTLKESMEGL